MPYLKDELAKTKLLAEAPTLGNLHPDARAQAIARAVFPNARAQAVARSAAERLAWLHSPASNNVDGYEWGIFRVQWEGGKAIEVSQTNSDFSDLDAAMSSTTPSGDKK